MQLPIKIDNKRFMVNENEFNTINSNEYFPILARSGLSELKWNSHFLSRLSEIFDNLTLYDYNTTHGGYIFDNLDIPIYSKPLDETHKANIQAKRALSLAKSVLNTDSTSFIYLTANSTKPSSEEKETK